MMSPQKKDSVWNHWLQLAQTSPAAKIRTDRIVNRPAVEFYDLQKDPFELANLAGEPFYQKQIAAYTVKLKEWMNQQGDRGAETDREYSKQAK